MNYYVSRNGALLDEDGNHYEGEGDAPLFITTDINDAMAFADNYGGVVLDADFTQLTNTREGSADDN